MPTPAPLLDRPDLITPEWLTDALQGSGVAPPGARVTGLTAEGIGTGQVGQNVRFTLAWSGAEAGEVPATVVGKFAAADPESRQAGLLTGTYVREVNFYRHLAADSAMRVPICHVAELDPGTGAFVLLFEDISPAEQGDQIAGCSPDRAALAMEELGRLHASFAGHPGLAAHDEWLKRRAHPDSAGMLAMMYGGFTDGFVERYAGRLDDATIEVVRAFGPRIGAWLATDTGPDAGPISLLHTDFRLDNILFGTGPGAPPMVTVDWQTPALGAAASDAAYFLGAGLSVQQRRSHERDLLEVYRSSLAAGGVEVSSDALWRAYRLNAGAGLHMAVVASMLVGRHDRGDEMFCTMAERHAAHLDDLGTLTLLDEIAP